MLSLRSIRRCGLAFWKLCRRHHEFALVGSDDAPFAQKRPDLVCQGAAGARRDAAWRTAILAGVGVQHD